MGFFYTAITHNETNEIRFAEHFVDEGEMIKRSKQLHIEAVNLGPWKMYAGNEPPEAFLIRLYAKPEGSEEPKEGDDKETLAKKWEAFSARVDKEAAKAGSKTISVLTVPEIDDTQELRQLPAWAIAQHAMEKSAQYVIDAKQASSVLNLRADNLADAAYSRDASSIPEGQRKEAIRKALSAQQEADYAKARLYHAEQDYAEKKAEFDRLFAEYQESNLQH